MIDRYIQVKKTQLKIRDMLKLITAYSILKACKRKIQQKHKEIKIKKDIGFASVKISKMFTNRLMKFGDKT